MTVDWINGQNVATFVGFTGVMVTLWWNARLQRQQHEREAKHERAAVACVLLAELKANLDTFTGDLNTLQSIKPDASLARPLKPNMTLYESHLDRLGRLDIETLTAVASAYAYIRTIPERLILAITMSVGVPSTSHGFLITPPEALKLPQLYLEEAIPELQQAVVLLEKQVADGRS